jgi:hypothetical protein
MPDPKTEEMQLEQLRRESEERERADQSAESAEKRAHDRRADRAAYLKEKLDERARSEDEAGG